MTMISRRSFLKLAGISVVSVNLPVFRPMALATGETETIGRAFRAAPVYRAKNPNSGVHARLWPDSVVPILDRDGDWYHIPGGYVASAELQPMMPKHDSAVQENSAVPFWAEVAGAVASVRAFCAADAPLVTRVGHGAVLYVIDWLPDANRGWYGVAGDNGDLLGWTQAVHWQTIEDALEEPSEWVVQIDRSAGQLTVLQAGETVLLATCALAPELAPGHYAAERKLPSTSILVEEMLLQGVPWVTEFAGGLRLAGVYWHNRFGEVLPGPDVQVTPWLARWLYDRLDERSMIIVT